MKFEEAIAIAKNECGFIHAAEERVINAIIHDVKTPCYLFAIDGIVYYFGFDGVDLHKGKHNAKRSEQLINRGEVWIIR